MIINPYRFGTALIDYPFAEMSDDFNDNSRNASKWNIGAFNPAPEILVNETNGQLEFFIPDNLGGTTKRNGYLSRRTYDFTNRAISFNFKQYLSTGNNNLNDCRFGLASSTDNSGNAMNGANLIEIIQGGAMFYRIVIAGTVSDVSSAVNGATEKFFRISHTSYNNFIHFHASTDGITWTLKRSVSAAGLDITSMKIYLSAGVAGQLTVQQQPIIDSFKAEEIAALTGTFDDKFNDNARDAAKWVIGYVAANDALITVNETNSHLEIMPRTATAAFGQNGYVSNNLYNFTNKAAQIELVNYGGTNLADSRFGVYTDANNYIFIIFSNGNLVLRSRVAGVNSDTTVAYSATAHRFWRIRHSSTDDKIYWETSPDGFSWSAVRNLVRSQVITAMKVNITGGSNGSIAAPQAIIFDNFISDLA